MKTGTATVTETRGVKLPGAKAKPRKYRNVPTRAGGILFASKREAARYVELRALAKAGKIIDLELQPRFGLAVNGVAVCHYRADFGYWEPGGNGYVRVVEDVKGVRTPVYRLKKKLMLAVHGIAVREV